MSNPWKFKFQHDPVKMEMVDNLRDRMEDLKTGVIYGNLINKKHGAEDRLFKADDTLISMQKDEAKSSHHGIRQLMDLVQSRFSESEDGYWDDYDEDEEF